MTAAATVLGALVGLGVSLVVAGLRGSAPNVTWQIPNAVSSASRVRWLTAAVLTGIVAAVTTGWPVLGLLTTTAMLVTPGAVSNRRRVKATERGEAVARWTEMLRDTIAGSAGLEEAVALTARRPPPPIAAAVSRLAARLEYQSLPDALAGFADDVDDPTADLLVVALVAASTYEAREVGAMLGALADATRAQAATQQAIDAGRAQIRSSTRLVLGVTGVFVAALVLFSSEYLAPYGTVEGQLWLGVVGAVSAASLLLLGRLDSVSLPGRPRRATAEPR